MPPTRITPAMKLRAFDFAQEEISREAGPKSGGELGGEFQGPSDGDATVEVMDLTGLPDANSDSASSYSPSMAEKLIEDILQDEDRTQHSPLFPQTSSQPVCFPVLPSFSSFFADVI